MPKRGLPVTLKMRHDAHYVDTLAASAAPPIGRLVAIDKVDRLMNLVGELVLAAVDGGARVINISFDHALSRNAEYGIGLDPIAESRSTTWRR